MDVGTARNQLLKLIGTIRCKEDLYDGVSVIHCGGAFVAADPLQKPAESGRDCDLVVRANRLLSEMPDILS